MNAFANVWSAESCGLIEADGICAAQLADIRMNPEGKDAIRAGCEEMSNSADATTYMIAEPSYTPHVSGKVRRYRQGDDMGWKVIRAAHSSELRESVESSPVAKTVINVISLVGRELWATEGAQRKGMDLLSEISPKKGGEVRRLLDEYLARNADSAESAVPMILRDFFASIYRWQVPRVRDGRMLDLCGATRNLTMAVDYPGAPDDSAGGGHDSYVAAASEGLACLGGKAATQALKDSAVTDAVILMKNSITASYLERSGRDKGYRPAPEAVTPEEYLVARWWDGDMVGFYRLAMGTAEYRHLSDELGCFRAIRECGRMRRVVENLIRYNDIIDVISDYTSREAFNEIHVALSAKGSDSVVGYADALAAVTDRVIDCDCREDGHQEAAEMGMGACLWYLIVPRYRGRAQIDCLSRAPRDDVRAGFDWLPCGERLTAVSSTALAAGNTLHSPEWEPLWFRETQGNGDRGADSRTAVEDLARRTARRIRLPCGGEIDPVIETLQAEAKEVLEGCESLTDKARLRALSEKWCRLFDIGVLDPEGKPIHSRDSQEELRSLIPRIWNHVVVGSEGPATSDTDEGLFIDVDRTISRTYQEPREVGLTLRRAFLGVTTSAVELSGLNPYGRLVDGVARFWGHRE
ncbi:hypothetical protein [Streptomyces sp. SID3343]|uniref:hypothetical protein n=1 Tax=Streptomyces sp. SID3343 TaxID=2690260 RepID=UPI00136F03C8|nr:hypothetical protein [Streptomyces sp. SID3343]MYV99007.1 hypothetical protein [Streptomyces sp. SID3343]